MEQNKEQPFSRLDFPEVTDPEIAFGGYPREWFASVMKTEDRTEDRKWENLAEELFFEGGKIPFNETLPEAYRRKGKRILQAVLGSFEPKHEHKTKVCGLILKSLCEES